jgi:prepilin-type N-terminal cleavage/methylation domain-containing protein
MKQTAPQRGFTLLELLIVVAIIGIMTAISIDYLSGSRERGAETGTRQNLVNARSQAEVYFANNNTYEGLCNNVSQGIFRQVRAAARAQGIITSGSYTDTTEGTATQEVCHDTAASYAAWVPLSGGDSLCIDSTTILNTDVPGLASSQYLCL